MVVFVCLFMWLGDDGVEGDIRILVESFEEAIQRTKCPQTSYISSHPSITVRACVIATSIALVVIPEPGLSPDGEMASGRLKVVI